jgi:hypothetical protein
MDKSKIFIASSGRTLLLAEKLRDELQTDYCEATLWSEEGRSQPGATIIETLENAAQRFDFAVIILAQDDVVVGGKGDTLKARDNCVFEAGLFIASLGRKRCFLVNSVNQSDLPSDLGGIISIPFAEPQNLSDRSECQAAIARVAPVLKDAVQREGRSAYHAHIPLLSVAELFRRERPQSEGGDLREGQVVVCDTQPIADVELALQVRRNIKSGTSYHYFLLFAENTAEKICQSLQVILAAGAGGEEKIDDFITRVSTIRNAKQLVLDDLRSICSSRSLRFTLFIDEPQFCFRVHNASNPELARVYARYFERGFVLWAQGLSAVAVWRALPKYLADDRSDRLFVPLKQFDLLGDDKVLFESSLDRALRKYFPGMEEEVKQIIMGGAS